MNAELPLAGLTALVTGGAEGIGLGIAIGFIEAGARVWVADAREGAPAAVARGVHYLQADLGSDEELDGLVSHLSQAIDHLDILVNNAGVDVRMPLESLDRGALDRIWRVNARAPALLIAGLSQLLKTSGRASIINITSIHDSVPYALNAPYCMSKAALAMLTNVASIELAPLGIRVNSLAPGAIETNASQRVIDAIGRDHFNAWIPAGRVGQVADLVGPAIFLASDASRYVTGTTIYADGAYRHHLIRYRNE
jgi:NAD(P)-dependent dehydrogenase (short-subunit alcohol dehydrogenase family)